MMNDRQVIEWVGEYTELGDLRLPNRATEYVRARAVAIKLIAERGASKGEIARLFRCDPKTIWHSLKNWDATWVTNPAAIRLYEAVQVQLAD